ncbi:MAG: YraN family protein [Candidatus Aminicenantes bacterium]|nr:YraN family protein [Candidatus Aminicenantes bacterium]
MASLPFGRWGEEIAAEFLEKKGYFILDRHFIFRHAEIDLVARDGSYLVFVEVKTRSSAEYGLPEEALSERKKRLLRRAAEGYLYLNQLTGVDCRFDVVTVNFLPDGTTSLNHYINAFE